MLEIVKDLGGGAGGAAVFFLLAYAVKYLVARSAARNRVAIAEITATGKRDELALASSQEAAEYLRASLADARAEIRDLRTRLNEINSQLIEAKNANVDMGALHKSGMRAFKARIEELEAALADVRKTMRELQFRYVNLHRLARDMHETLAALGHRDLPPLPPLPPWIEEPRRLTDGEDSD